MLRASPFALVCASSILFVFFSCFGSCNAHSLLSLHDAPSFLTLPRSEAIPLNLTHRAFPLQPGAAAAAWLPPSFDPASLWILIVHFHGFHNCVVNAVGNVSSSCTPSQPARVAYSLGQQLDASSANAVLLLPEGSTRLNSRAH